MISTGFDDDEDDRHDEVPCCGTCGHELGQDLFEDWYCGECEPKQEDKE